MVSKANWKTWVIMGAAVALFVTSGGLLMASNMGFKINMGLQNAFAAPGPKGDNWRSLPWNGPNSTFTILCNTFAAAGASKGNINVSAVDPTTGGALGGSCVAAAGAIPVGRGIRVRVTGLTPPLSPNSIVIVGSSNETAAFPSIFGPFAAPGPKGDNWLSIPYHTTWTKAQDICTTFGSTVATGLPAGSTITRVDASTGSPISFNCVINTGTNFSLVIGESVRIRKPNPPIPGIVPPHF